MLTELGNFRNKYLKESHPYLIVNSGPIKIGVMITHWEESTDDFCKHKVFQRWKRYTLGKHSGLLTSWIGETINKKGIVNKKRTEVP